MFRKSRKEEINLEKVKLIVEYRNWQLWAGIANFDVKSENLTNAAVTHAFEPASFDRAKKNFH